MRDFIKTASYRHENYFLPKPVFTVAARMEAAARSRERHFDTRAARDRSKRGARDGKSREREDYSAQPEMPPKKIAPCEPQL